MPNKEDILTDLANQLFFVFLLRFMPPDDPLGRNGPTIENFLRKKPLTPEPKLQHCPYGRSTCGSIQVCFSNKDMLTHVHVLKENNNQLSWFFVSFFLAGKKCTYGVKCKFYHPERSNQPQLSVADELRAKTQPSSITEELPPSDYQTGTVLNHDQLTRALSGLDLYSSPTEAQNSMYLKRSLPALCKSIKSDQAYGSLESSISRPYLSDSALQTSLAYSSGCDSGSSSDYFLSGGSNMQHRRARTPDIPSRSYSPDLHALSGCRHTHSDISLGYAHLLYPNHGYQHHSPYNNSNAPFCNEALPYPQVTPSQLRVPDMTWSQGHGEVMDRETDRRRDVRSQLSTIFPQSIVDQVMSLYPHTLDTKELVMLIQKYKNSALL